MLLVTDPAACPVRLYNRKVLSKDSLLCDACDQMTNPVTLALYVQYYTLGHKYSGPHLKVTSVVQSPRSEWTEAKRCRGRSHECDRVIAGSASGLSWVSLLCVLSPSSTSTCFTFKFLSFGAAWFVSLFVSAGFSRVSVPLPLAALCLSPVPLGSLSIFGVWTFCFPVDLPTGESVTSALPSVYGVHNPFSPALYETNASCGHPGIFHSPAVALY